MIGGEADDSPSGGSGKGRAVTTPFETLMEGQLLSLMRKLVRGKPSEDAFVIRSCRSWRGPSFARGGYSENDAIKFARDFEARRTVMSWSSHAAASDDFISLLYLETDVRVGAFLAPAPGWATAIALRATGNIDMFLDA